MILQTQIHEPKFVNLHIRDKKRNDTPLKKEYKETKKRKHTNVLNLISVAETHM